MARGLSCSTACEIFLDQGLSLFPALARGFFNTEPPGKPYFVYVCFNIYLFGHVES